MKKIFSILLFLFSISAFATHERAGEITYKCLGGLTYEITLTIYTKGSSYPADRCFEEIYFGSDTVHYRICRCNYEPGDPTTDPWGGNCSFDPSCPTLHMGEWSMFDNCLDIKKNVYCVTHTYPGPGSYVISFDEPNRINDIVNIPNPSAFHIETTLVINPFITPCSSSPTFINPALDTAFAGICHTYNPMSVDPDGDSLSYHLIPCMDGGGPIAGYYIPSGVSLDSITGDLIWCSPPNVSPPTPNLWNFAIQIKKWRKINNQYMLIGTSMRDIQIFVEACAGMSVNEKDSELPFINIYPNPASDLIHLQTINMKYKSYDFNVVDFTGKIILKGENITDENHTLSSQQFRNGLYLLKAYSSGKNIFSETFQVQH